MPRYYFDIHNGDVLVDNIGTECDDIEVVRREARLVLPELAREFFPADRDHHTIRVVVRDEHNVVVYTATLVFSGQIVEGRGTTM